MDHQKALKEKSDGFNTIELEIFTKLANAASSLGAKLLSIEVRELSFPQLEAQEVTLASKVFPSSFPRQKFLHYLSYYLVKKYPSNHFYNTLHSYFTRFFDVFYKFHSSENLPHPFL